MTLFINFMPTAEEEHIPTYEPVNLEPSKYDLGSGLHDKMYGVLVGTCRSHGTTTQLVHIIYMYK